MKTLSKLTVLVAGMFLSIAVTAQPKAGSVMSAQREQGSLPAALKGDFIDDYDISYFITDSIWTQLPNMRFQVIAVDTVAGWILARNDIANPADPGLYTRIDYTRFTGMAPFEWGFCLSVYNAATDSAARAAVQADRMNPKKGCNGFPFSRMKRISMQQSIEQRDSKN